MAELATLLRKYKDAYYNGHPLVSDAAYDQLEDELRALDPSHAVLASVGAPVPTKAKPRAAGAPVTEWEKAQHKLPMGSLNKATDEAEFSAWVARCEEHAARDKLPKVVGDLFVTEKLDGISLEVIYEDGVMTEAITRGDGQIGERITTNVARMKGVPPRLKEKLHISVRGEIVLKLTDMKRSFPNASNARNMASGTAKRFDGNGCEHLTVLFYDLEGEESVHEVQKFARLKQLGFETPNHYPTDAAGALQLYRQYAASKRAEVDYEIDGLVIAATRSARRRCSASWPVAPGRDRAQGRVADQGDAAQSHRLGHRRLGPGHADRRVRPGVERRRGPRARQPPQHLQRQALGISEGDEILVSRRNDVIPQVEEVVVKHGPPAVIPTTCAVCAEQAGERGRVHLLPQHPVPRGRRGPPQELGRGPGRARLRRPHHRRAGAGQARHRAQRPLQAEV
ncbi:hypothetical protein [Nannocystis sp.]|uniref:hypothetical protein n=1 Tax=Nannocystis sp. TaxID=1962667 RepID=UPI0025D7CDE5|nr:hypothetical protein [Nannocystis sp.]